MTSRVVESIDDYVTALRASAAQRGVHVLDAVVRIPPDHVWVECQGQLSAEDVVVLAQRMAASWIALDVDDAGRSITLVFSSSQYSYSYIVADWILTRRGALERALFHDRAVRQMVDRRDDVRAFLTLVHEYFEPGDDAVSAEFLDAQVLWLQQSVFDRLVQRRQRVVDRAVQTDGRELIQAVRNFAKQHGIVLSHQPIQAELEYGLQQWFEHYSGGFVLTSDMLAALVDVVYQGYVKTHSAITATSPVQQPHNSNAEQHHTGDPQRQ